MYRLVDGCLVRDGCGCEVAQFVDGEGFIYKLMEFVGHGEQVCFYTIVLKGKNS